MVAAPIAAPIAEGLFAGPVDAPHLLGSACRACGVVVFPAQGSCPRCTGTDVEVRALGRRGTLWSWTVQCFRPTAPPYAGPEEFEPFGVGIVELPGEVRVTGRLTVSDPDELRIGMEMETVLVPFNDRVTYAFAPVAR